MFSGFLWEYLYILLGGNWYGEFWWIVNLMMMMLLGGLWYGVVMCFVFWGGLYGVFFVLYGWVKKFGLCLFLMFNWVLMLFCVVLVWVFFCVIGFVLVMDFYCGLFGFNGFVIFMFYIKMLLFFGYFGCVVLVLFYLGDVWILSLL